MYRNGILQFYVHGNSTSKKKPNRPYPHLDFEPLKLRRIDRTWCGKGSFSVGTFLSTHVTISMCFRTACVSQKIRTDTTRVTKRIFSYTPHIVYDE